MTLSRKHAAGSVLPDRGDDLHWLQCCDCGIEWAENDDGEYVAGLIECAIFPKLLTKEEKSWVLEAIGEYAEDARRVIIEEGHRGWEYDDGRIPILESALNKIETYPVAD